MEPIIEIYDEKDLKKALKLNPRILMINNRDLSSFKVDIANTLDLIPHIPEDIIVISASGIKDGKDVEILARAGVKGILVGESIVTSNNPKEKIRELLSFSISNNLTKVFYEHNPNF